MQKDLWCRNKTSWHTHTVNPQKPLQTEKHLLFLNPTSSDWPQFARILTASMPTFAEKCRLRTILAIFQNASKAALFWFWHSPSLHNLRKFSIAAPYFHFFQHEEFVDNCCFCGINSARPQDTLRAENRRWLVVGGWWRRSKKHRKMSTLLPTGLGLLWLTSIQQNCVHISR